MYGIFLLMKKQSQHILFALLTIVYCFSIGWHTQNLEYAKVAYEITDANKVDLNAPQVNVAYYIFPASQNSTINLTSSTFLYKEAFSDDEFIALTNRHIQKDKFYSYIKFSYSFITLFSVADIIFPFHSFW